MDRVDANLYGYEEIKFDRLFGIHGVINTSLSQEYANASEVFVERLNFLSYTPVSKYIYSYLNMLKINHQQQLNISYEFVKIDDRFNKLNQSKLNSFIMNDTVLCAIESNVAKSEYRLV